MPREYIYPYRGRISAVKKPTNHSIFCLSPSLCPSEIFFVANFCGSHGYFFPSIICHPISRSATPNGVEYPGAGTGSADGSDKISKITPNALGPDVLSIDSIDMDDCEKIF